jgi:hypothetical protein
MAVALDVVGLNRKANTTRLLEVGARVISETLELLNNGVFWDVTPCGSCKNRRFERI